MKPIFVRELSAEEQQALQAGLHAASAFTLRRCHILLAGAEERLKPWQIARRLHCSDQCLRDTLCSFNRDGLACLQAKSHAPHHTQAALEARGLERLRELVHTSPRAFGQEHSLWSLERLAQVCLGQGVTAHAVSDETIRRALKKLDINWKQAKQRIHSPDARYGLKKATRPVDRLGACPGGWDAGGGG